jgi:hypothetical protein
LDLSGPKGAVSVVDFPSAGFLDPKGGGVRFDALRRGRYWALLFAWEGSQLVPVCKVPFRKYDATSRFWGWYEPRFLRLWQRWFGGGEAEEPSR